MRDIIRANLTKQNLNTLLVDAAMKDIFGSKICKVVQTGLVDSLNAEGCGKRTKDLFFKWKDSYIDSVEELILYIKSKKSQLIKSSITAGVKCFVGLGYSPKPYTRKAYECLNGILQKVQQKYKKNY